MVEYEITLEPSIFPIKYGIFGFQIKIFNKHIKPHTKYFIKG